MNCARSLNMVRKDPIDPLLRYRYRVNDDPLRLSIFAAHALIEEMVEIVITEAVPKPDCLDVSKMWFNQKLKIIRALDPWPKDNTTEALWKCIEKLTKLRNSAAHRNYETERDKLFADLAEFFYPDPAYRSTRDRESLLEDSTELCTGMLLGMLDTFRKRREEP
jgi:hypothetical protein